MNKNDLIAAVAEKCGMSRADAGKAIDAMLDTITEALKKNDDVRMVGFGTLSVAQRSATQGPQSAHRPADPHPGLEAAEVQGRQGAQRRSELSVRAPPALAVVRAEGFEPPTPAV